MHSILVFIGDPAYREQVCADIVHGIRCPVYTASDFPAALSLLQAEKPTILMLTSDFANVHGKPIADVVAEFAPGTKILFVAPPARAAAAGASP